MFQQHIILHCGDCGNFNSIDNDPSDSLMSFRREELLSLPNLAYVTSDTQQYGWHWTALEGYSAQGLLGLSCQEVLVNDT